jgi:hypothetical protein
MTFEIFETNFIEESFYNFDQISKFSFNSNILIIANDFEEYDVYYISNFRLRIGSHFCVTFSIYTLGNSHQNKQQFRELESKRRLI